jgi:hypothetical protein
MTRSPQLAGSQEVRKEVVRNHRHPPCKAVSIASRCSSTFSSSTPPLIYTAPIAPTAALYGSNMACTPIRKTSWREYETPRRSRFRAYLEEGHSVARAAQLAEVPRSTIRGWISIGDRRPGKERPGRPSIISNEKMKEIAEWMTGHFDRRAMPL